MPIARDEEADISIISNEKVTWTVIGYACRLPAQSLLDHAKGVRVPVARTLFCIDAVLASMKPFGYAQWALCKRRIFAR